MTLDQFRNAEWMLDAIEGNAQSFDYEVAGYWDTAMDAITTYATDEDEHRADVGNGIEAIAVYCTTGDKRAALNALNAAYKTSLVE
tara:strand:+ start:447 stop:704 length:258 start_codon:yes stop_codon:yes gene_type:complete